MKGRFAAHTVSGLELDSQELQGFVKGNTLTLVLGDDTHSFTLRSLETAQRFCLEGSGERKTIAVSRDSKGTWVTVQGHTYLFKAAASGNNADRGGSLRSPMPAKVVAVQVKVGDAVTAQQTLVILEAMKMEIAIKAPCDGTVSALHVKAGDQIDGGLQLLELDRA